MAKLFPFHWAHPDMGFEVTSTPLGQPCQACTVPIGDYDVGIILPFHAEMGKPPTDEPWHRQCFLKHLGIADRTQSDEAVRALLSKRTGHPNDAIRSFIRKLKNRKEN